MKSLYLRIVGEIEAQIEWFQPGYDALGKKVLRRYKNVRRPFANSQPVNRRIDLMTT